MGERDEKSQFEGAIEERTMTALKILVETTKIANRLPSGKTRDLYESCPAFHNVLKTQSHQVLSSLSAVMKYVNFKGNFSKRDDDDKLELIIDVNDSLLEKVSISLDEISGIHRNAEEANAIAQRIEFFNGTWNKSTNACENNKTTHVMNSVISRTKNMEKPQLKFKEAINNDANVAFEPKIKFKYNLLKPLSILMGINENGLSEYSHPYEFELSKFKPADAQMVWKQPQAYRSLEETPLRFVTSKDDVSSMIENLLKHKEIAVDLEHHSYRSFQGFTCLMQISTRDADYVIDAISLRSELEELNKVFTDSNILKVFHGADSDILWLQRDLALYVVNMFDTHQAVKLLNYPNLSLAYLLKYYCNVDAQKHYQLADWRVRPLPDELLTYAREDTHYLLYIYDQLRNRLIETANGQTNLLMSVMAESTRICSRVYQKPIYDEDGHHDIYRRSKKLFDNRQKFALQSLYAWRDKTARDLDESLSYVLPNHMMLNISEILPREAQGILACCNPVPQPVRQNLLHLHQLILKAREEPLVKPVLEEQQFCRHVAAANSSDDPLHCPHDLNHEGDFRDDLPVLLMFGRESKSGSEAAKNESDEHRCYKPIVSVFENKICFQVKADRILISNPYERYKLAKKFSESVEAEKIKGYIQARESKEQASKKDHSNASDVTVESTVVTLNANRRARTDSPVVEDAKREGSGVGVPSEVCNAEVKEPKTERSEEPPIKKPRTENVAADAPRDARGAATGKDGSPAKGKRNFKDHSKRQEKPFVPYSYESADFDKFKSPSVQGKGKRLKVNRRRGHNRRTTKNLKISI